MSLLLRLERRLEAMVEGVFARWGRDRVHPVEIARRLFREMDQGAAAGLGGLMLPNAYRVFLHPKDFEPYAAVAAPLAAEMEDALASRARELGGQFPGAVRVALTPRDEIAPGEIYVEARLAPNDAAGAAVPAPAPEGSGAPPQPEAAAEPPRRGVPSSAAPGDGGDTRVYRVRPGDRPAPRLRVRTGPAGAAGREFVLDRPIVTVGRRPDQDVVLDDPSVSRAHARIELGAGRAAITDLGSTNGTLLNGARVGRAGAPLAPGDRIQLGTVLLEFLAAP